MIMRIALTLVIGVLIGVFVTCWPGFRQTIPLVNAELVDNNGPVTMLSARLGSTEEEALFLWEHATQKLAIYAIGKQGLELKYFRNCQYDFVLPGNLGTQKPTVKDIKRQISGHKPPANTSGVSPAAGGGFTITVSRMQGGNQDAIEIYDQARQRLCVYMITGNKLELKFTRDVSYDLKVPTSIGNVSPTIPEMMELIKKGRKGKQ